MLNSRDSRRLRVLIVDDYPVARRIFITELAPYGVETFEAGDAAEALAIASEQNPDVVVLDLFLTGSSGLEVARELRARRGGDRIVIIALSGHAGEEYLELARREGLSTMSLRYANVYGPGQDPLGEAGVVAIFLHKMLHGADPVINGDGEQTRDFVYVADVARANLLALESAGTGALNVGTGEETSINELARILARAAGYAKPIAHGPAAPGEQRRSSVAPAAARRQLGWSPDVTLEAGLGLTAEWFRDRSRPNSR